MQETWGNNIFQSTHPLRGATVPSRLIEHFVGISIHAPLAGCDPGQYHDSPREGNFNPRTPCGVRHKEDADGATNVYFNPRTPCGVRPPKLIVRTVVVRFQSTHPLRGATAPNNAVTLWDIFQSTHPLRGATGQYIIHSPTHFISIHAPLAGCDHHKICKTFDFRLISIHAPLAGCDHLICSIQCSIRISIHAPLAGCDDPVRHISDPLERFQSTHPLRGATTITPSRSTTIGYFNPRTPCGVRLCQICLFSSFRAISIHAPLAGCDQ